VILPQPHRQPRHTHQPVAFLPHPVLDSSTPTTFKKVSTKHIGI
jgi:hypothetical protein